MTAALTLITGALAASWLVPHWLQRADFQRWDPMLLIVGWLASMAAVVLTALTGVTLLLLPGHGPAVVMLAAARQCWSAIQHGSSPKIEELVGVLGIAVIFALAARISVLVCRDIRRRARLRAEHLSVLRLTARTKAGSPDTLWLPHDRPLAFSLTGRHGVIFATDGLAKHLPDTGVAAVLAHERAHLVGRHHLITATADAMRAALPFIPLFRDAPRVIRELVELSADVVAVQQCGRTSVRSALLAVSRHGTPGTSLAMARDAVDIRLARLSHDCPPSGRTRRTISSGLATVSAVILPSLLGTGLLLGAALLACPVGLG